MMFTHLKFLVSQHHDISPTEREVVYAHNTSSASLARLHVSSKNPEHIEQVITFDVLKRNRGVMAETALFRGQKFSGNFVIGKHKESKYMTGVVFRYNF